MVSEGFGSQVIAPGRLDGYLDSVAVADSVLAVVFSAPLDSLDHGLAPVRGFVLVVVGPDRLLLVDQPEVAAVDHCQGDSRVAFRDLDF